ncbi:MAG: glycosyltransferase family 2 protein [Candidatus Zixiibacteriota bacterium]
MPGTRTIDLSVIIPVFNGEGFIRDCLRAVIAELHFLSSEIICIDDGSTDGSARIISSEFPAITLVRHEDNRGFARACNSGLERAKGSVVFLLNQDTRCREDSVRRMYERIAADISIGLIGPRFVGFDGKLQKKCSAFPTFANLTYKFSGLARLFPGSRHFNGLSMGWFDHECEMVVEQPMGAALMLRRGVLEEIGPLDESFPIFFNDVDWALRIVRAGYRNLYFPRAVVEHYVGSATRPQKPRMVRESHRSLYRFLAKHYRGIRWWPALFSWRIILYLSGLLRAVYWTARMKRQ